jgi:undecaprenyl-diphosphatase
MSENNLEKSVEIIQDSVLQAVREESAPAPVRRKRALLFQTTLGAIAVAFAILTFLVTSSPSNTIDLQITRSIQLINSPLFASLMSLVSWPGFIPQAVIISGLIIVGIFALGLQWEAVMTVLAALFTTGINVLAKELVQRPRPLAGTVNVVETLNSYSFPSGHVMFYLGFLGFIAFLVFSLMKRSIKRSIFLLLIGFPIVLVGISRIYLGQHWASDVLGSYLLGSLTLAATIQCYRWGKTRFFVQQPRLSSRQNRAGE